MNFVRYGTGTGTSDDTTVWENIPQWVADMYGLNVVHHKRLHSYGQCEDCGSVELLSWCLLCYECHRQES